jgi:hypothetical protein
MGIFGVVVIHGASILVPNGHGARAILDDMGRFAAPAFILLCAYFFELGYARADDHLIVGTIIPLLILSSRPSSHGLHARLVYRVVNSFTKASN